ncbi:hypothetical protein POTOM_018017 [Populus tomentosa]|uniref:UTP23 sensor motif region domain-containing protein n=1 Tax=Populus tomentosa TaxID=118781 RepID=A0A8X8ABT9_POPTO|nr:hypothetical protein POTOM_018017 [Populus tomentosa]
MRVKKQKRHRRAVRFYTACFGFRQPYKVLCDGTFIHHLIVNNIAPADTAISNILGGSVKLFTTRSAPFCFSFKLKRLGKSYTESLQAANTLMIARCDHEQNKNAEGCIVEIIGENNPDHFYVGTQDTDMRKKFQEHGLECHLDEDLFGRIVRLICYHIGRDPSSSQVPGVPLIFGLRNALFLEPPSAFQRQFAKNSEEERSHMTEKEVALLKKRTKDLVENWEIGDSSDENGGPEDENLEMQPQKYSSRKGMKVKDRPQFKRNKAKGPNPLSVQKKKSRQNPNTMSGKLQLGGFGAEIHGLVLTSSRWGYNRECNLWWKAKVVMRRLEVEAGKERDHAKAKLLLQQKANGLLQLNDGTSSCGL